ncbi:hypothetical protein MLD38_020783 [Melastoma candidum]|uniref:Uncharacterized protein n=1 Tax=Melastoma candidum TaxID=119954 RepID=A0ACB9QHT9_9MYRT|nr:hypothetical protein MLD38_020783 [Melastoma candidum]
MQRYHAANCNSAVNNTVLGGASARDSARAESSAIPSNYSVNSRRQYQLVPYRLKCEKEPLNSRLGPPDYHPHTLDCPEETLNREYVQSGYKETVEGLEEARESTLSQIHAFTKPVVLKCKEAIRKRFRAINESRAQKRKAGQVYGVPLAGSLLSKPAFPEQKSCSEDFRRRWVEALSQPHKRLRSLADQVPHGYRKRPLLEILIKNNVPLLRATWFVKITYLNQVRLSSTSIASTPDKNQLSRAEVWTKDVIDYMQYLLDEFVKNNYLSTSLHKDQSPQMLYGGHLTGKMEGVTSPIDGEEPSLQFKWWYMVRLIQWHHSEGLLLPTPVIDWVLTQLQDKELLEILQLLLPILYGVIESVISSQTYVRSIANVAVRFIREPSPGGSDLVDNSRRAYTCSAVVEMLRYLILAIPNTFVGLDCFPLPSCVLYQGSDGSFVSKASEDVVRIDVGSLEVASLFKRKAFDGLYHSLSFENLVSSIQKLSDKLTHTVSPGSLSGGYAQAVQALDSCLVSGDLREAHRFLFEDFCEGALDSRWLAEVSSCLRSSLRWMGGFKLSVVYSVFFLCEWATCDYRNSRTTLLADVKYTGKKDYSRVHVAVWILKLKSDLEGRLHAKNIGAGGFASQRVVSQDDNSIGRGSVANVLDPVISFDDEPRKKVNVHDIFESPSSIHDVLVCWIDQHERTKGDGQEDLLLLIVELTQCGLFNPLAYVRQLLISGIVDLKSNQLNLEKRMRHYYVLKQLSGLLVRDALKQAKIAEGRRLLEALRVYSNERRLLLQGLVNIEDKNTDDMKALGSKRKRLGGSAGSLPSVDDSKALEAPPPRKSHKITANMEELKSLIIDLMQFPSLDSSVTTGTDESEGSTKRPYGSMDNRVEFTEGNSGCEECRRVKKQKLSDENSDVQVHSPLSDAEDIWWVRKGFKSLETLRVDPLLKSSKQASWAKLKVVRRTQSLAELAASRIEDSQGASTSHVCDNRTNCPHHGPNIIEGDAPKSFDWIGPEKSADVVLIGKALKQLRLSKRRGVCLWLVNMVRNCIDEAEKTSVKVGQLNRNFTPIDDRLSSRWKLGEEELSNVLYLLDTSEDLISAVKLLLWLLPKNLRPNAAIHTGRSMTMLQRHSESHVCQIGEAFLVSSLRRYENTLIAADLIPLALSALSDRATAVITSNNRVTSSFALAYTRYLLKKYGNVTSVVEWRKRAKANGDKRILSELESGRSPDGEFGFPLGVPTGVEDLDDFLRQKIASGRLSRVGMSMREVVQRRVEEVVQLFSGKDKKLLATSTLKIPSTEQADDGYQAAEQIVLGIMECMKQTGGAAQEGDPSLVASAVSAIVGSVGPTLAKLPELTAPSVQTSLPLSSSALIIARQILRLHVSCLCLLREALGDRQSRVFEIALATESASALAGASGPSKSARNQYQFSPESHESSPGTYSAVVRATKVAASVSALLIGAITQGITSLERMISVFRLKEGLDVVQFLKSTRSTSNGNIRSPAFKAEISLEISVHFFRLLLGNCKTLCDGLIVELLGEPSMIALSRMQQTLPLTLVFPPAYCIFAFLIWRPIIMNSNLTSREDIHQLYQSLIVAMGDAVKHLPFRNACLRDCLGLYDLIAADTTDLEFASMLEMNGSNMRSKSRAFVPLRARLFLNAIIDCRLPSSFTQDDRNRGSGQGESKDKNVEDGTKLLDRLVHVLNTLQPAKFHWQWLELRLLLNEQDFVDKLEIHDMSLGDALRTLGRGTERDAVSENEKYFIEIILTRLLTRPDAAPLFAEVLHLFGRSLDDSMLLLTKWFLEGQDVLLGRKTIRQRLINIAENKGLSTKLQYWKNWGWSIPGRDTHVNISDKKKHEMGSLEEGEVLEEGADSRRHRKVKSAGMESSSQQHATEKALIELVVPCINRSSDESQKTFASDLIKQLNAIEQQINAVTHGTSKSAGAVPSGSEGSAGKTNNRKGMRGGSPGLARRQATAAAAATAADSMPPSAAAFRGSISLRLHFLLRLLPVICADREPMGRNLRHMLASVILRLLGNQLIYDDAGGAFCHVQSYSSKRDGELRVEPSSHASPCLFGESLFDWLLSVLHGLLSSYPPTWLKSRPTMRMDHENVKDFPEIDKDAAENLQNELENMQLPDKVRWRIQAAMPVYLPSTRCIVSCQLPSVPASAVSLMQSSISSTGPTGNPYQKNSITNSRMSPSLSGKSKPTPPVQPDSYPEVDAWTLLEDGGGSAPSSGSSSMISSGDSSNLRASYWLKGALRVRRTDLVYVGSVDDDT